VYFQIVYIIVIIYEILNVKIALNIILIGLVSKLLVIFLMILKVFKFFI